MTWWTLYIVAVVFLTLGLAKAFQKKVKVKAQSLIS